MNDCLPAAGAFLAAATRSSCSTPLIHLQLAWQELASAFIASVWSRAAPSSSRRAPPRGPALLHPICNAQRLVYEGCWWQA